MNFIDARMVHDTDSVNLSEKIKDLSKVPNEYEWNGVAAGTLVYTLPEGVVYDPASKWLEVTVGGAPVPSSMIQKDSPSQFTLLIDPSYVPENVDVVARWVETYVAATTGHSKIHEVGGQDEIDLTKLKNYNLVTTSLSTLGTDVNLLKRKQKNIFVDVVEDFGADPTGAIDSTVAFANAVAYVASKGGGEINLPFGLYKGDIVVTSSNITISGNGTLRGTIRLYGADRSLMSRYTGTTGIKVKGITIDGLEANHGITMKWVFGVDISDCTFKSCVKAINFEPFARGQHCSRVNIFDNRFIDCNYAVFNDHIDTLAGEVPYSIGDITFNNNFCEARLSTTFGNIYNLHMKGLDGLVCKGNTFFFNPNIAARKSNIYIELFNWAIIEGNQLFEAVEHAVHCVNGSNLQVRGNNSAWSKQEAILADNISTATISNNNLNFKDDAVNMAKRTGILVQNSPFFIGSIEGNAIYFPNEHAIRIENSSHISIGNNTARNKYSLLEPVKINFTNCGSINVTGNTFTGYTYSMAKVIAAKPISSTVTFNANNDGTNRSIIQGVMSPAFTSFTNNSASIDISNINLAVFANTVATTITSITTEDLNATIVRFVKVFSYNGNTTISRTIPNVTVKGTGASVNIPAGESMEFMIYGGSIKELSRSFPVV